MHFTRSLAFVATSFALACSYTGLATETASNDLGCPQDQLVVTNPATRTYTARGCGKEQTYYCDYVHSDPGQADDHAEVVCKTMAEASAAVDAEHAAEGRWSACIDACQTGTHECADGCRDDQCRSLCKTMGDGCAKGCSAAR